MKDSRGGTCETSVKIIPISQNRFFDIGNCFGVPLLTIVCSEQGRGKKKDLLLTPRKNDCRIDNDYHCSAGIICYPLHRYRLNDPARKRYDQHVLHKCCVPECRRAGQHDDQHERRGDGPGESNGREVDGEHAKCVAVQQSGPLV